MKGPGAEEITQRISIEGADPLLLGGVNDVNLSELERATSARVSLRGESLTITGTPAAYASMTDRGAPSYQRVGKRRARAPWRRRVTSSAETVPLNSTFRGALCCKASRMGPSPATISGSPGF